VRISKHISYLPDALDTVVLPKGGDPILINPKTGKFVNGNGRAYELLIRVQS